MFRRSFYLGLIVMAIALTLVIAPSLRTKSSSLATMLFGGIGRSLHESGQKTRDFFSFFFKIDELKKRNLELSDEIFGLEIDKSRITELEAENAALKKEIGFRDESTNLQLVPAHIIGQDPTAFLDYITVDKGGNDGLKAGLPVVSQGVLVGQVKEISDHTAKITLITSKDSFVQAMLQDSRAKGIMKGGISGLFVENIPSDTEFKVGESIVTSGLDINVPQGILIGKAGKLQSSSSEIFKSIAVEPLVDFSRLELVFIEK